jgi:restriction system protein
MTITEAMKQVMRARGAPMSSDEAYKAIIAAGLYEFHEDDPAGIVRNQIRRHCEGLDFPTASPTKHFRLVGDGRYEPLNEVKKGPRKQRTRNAGAADVPAPVDVGPLTQLQALHFSYVADLKSRILNDLKRLSPAAFEQFSKRLLGKRPGITPCPTR